MKVPLRYLVGGILVFAASLLMWLGQPAYFGYLHSNYLWLIPLAMLLGFFGAWLCFKELMNARGRD